MLPEMEVEPSDIEDPPSPWELLLCESSVPKLGTVELPIALVLPDIEDELPVMLDPELVDPPPPWKLLLLDKPSSAPELEPEEPPPDPEP